MKLKQYPKYKKSGVQWIGKIPEGWSKNKIKHNILPLEKSGLEASEGNQEGKYPFFTSSQIQSKFIDNVVFNNECLILGTGGMACVHYFNGKFSVSTDCLVLKKQKNVYMKFLWYQILSNIKVIDDLGFEGMGLRHLQKDFFYNMLVYLPSEKEQEKITDFLDSKTSEISKTIEVDKKLIELLKEKRTALINHVVTKGLNPKAKMKDSGIEWIGEVPEEAKILPFRRVCYVNQGLQFPEDDRLAEPNEKSKIYITIKYIHAEEEGVKEYIPNPPKNVICKKEDILLARTGATGEVITNQEGVFHNNFFKINYNSNIFRNYLVYYLQVDSVKKILLLKAGVTTIPDLNHDAFLSTPFIYYEWKDQEKISSYLDKATSKIDQTIKKIEEKIELLEEFKKSLIHHVVTGKVDVREVVA